MNLSTPSRITLGGGRFSHLEQEAVNKLIELAFQLGIPRIDTAPSYPGSEKKIGTAIKGSEEFKITTKVGPAPAQILNAETVYRSVEKSLSELGVSKVECIYLHSVNPKHCDDSALSSLLELRSAGVTRRIGVSADNHDLEHYFQIGIFDQFMASFSVVDQLNYLTMKKIHEDNQLRLAIKRSLANGVWRKDLKARTLRLYRLMKHENEYFETGSYRNRYLEMSKELGTQLSGDDFMRFSFSLFQNATVLIGTNKLGHLKKVREVERSLGEDEEFTTKILNIFSATAGQNWNAMT